MRWKTKSEPQWLDTQIKEHFLFFPKKINNEWRWLEKAKYKQCYEEGWDDGIYYADWIDKEWIDEAKK